MKKAKEVEFNLIIPKGTQVVLLNETKVLNENAFHGKGTVGKIVGLPVDAFHAYKIEFPDGSCGMANRKDFSIRKEFQTEQSGLVSPLEDFQLFDFVIYRCIIGSRAFGLDDEDSDTDLRGIYLPPAEFHWSMFGVPEQIESRQTEECYWERTPSLELLVKTIFDISGEFQVVLLVTGFVFGIGFVWLLSKHDIEKGHDGESLRLFS